jgi:hypothetical protein
MEAKIRPKTTVLVFGRSEMEGLLQEGHPQEALQDPYLGNAALWPVRAGLHAKVPCRKGCWCYQTNVFNYVYASIYVQFYSCTSNPKYEPAQLESSGTNKKTKDWNNQCSLCSKGIYELFNEKKGNEE